MAWPPMPVNQRAGYRDIDRSSFRVLDGLAVPTGGRRAAIAVVAGPGSTLAALPLVDREGGWAVAAAGDGVSRAALALFAAAGTAADAGAGGAGEFRAELYEELPIPSQLERSLGTDQSNTSVVLGDDIIIKWRTAFEANGTRAASLRRHLAAHAFDGVPTLLGVLWWIGPDGELVLADIDACLPGAADGWDHFIAVLAADAEGDLLPGMGRTARLCADLGALSARLHVAFAEPSRVIPRPRGTAGVNHIEAWRLAAREALVVATAIEADDRAVLLVRQPALERDIDGLALATPTPQQATHGDLHLGQVVVARDGISIIDFDGPPRAVRGSDSGLEPAARDVAQLLCSLEQLAVVVDRNTQN